MRYIILNSVFLTFIVASLIAYTKKPITKITSMTIMVILVLTAVFDSLIIYSGIVGYNTDNILGVYIWRAPIEDFAYAVAAVLIVGLLWEYYESKK